MNDLENLQPPAALGAILQETESVGFTMASEQQTGSLLRTLAATKPGGKFLEIGTGTGAGSCWLLDGMDESSSLLTIDQSAEFSAIAKKHLGHDPRLQFLTGDAGPFLTQATPASFDFIFADSQPGKFYLLDETLGLLKTGGLYIIDDLLPQLGWAPDHPPKVAALIAYLENRADLRITKLNWASGLIVATKIRA
jgi:predicted O-methyltransferase YrrM